MKYFIGPVGLDTHNGIVILKSGRRISIEKLEEEYVSIIEEFVGDPKDFLDRKYYTLILLVNLNQILEIRCVIY